MILLNLINDILDLVQKSEAGHVNPAEPVWIERGHGQFRCASVRFRAGQNEKDCYFCILGGLSTKVPDRADRTDPQRLSRCERILLECHQVYRERPASP